MSFAIYRMEQDYRVRLEVKNLPADSQPILLRFYNGALFALDTLPVRSQNTFGMGKYHRRQF